MLSYPLGQLSEEDLAAALFMNKRTLARRLVKENTSYRLIRDRILSEKASSYLHDPQISVEAIASLLNYHDSAIFGARLNAGLVYHQVLIGEKSPIGKKKMT